MSSKGVATLLSKIDDSIECSLRGLAAKYECMYVKDPLRAHAEVLRLHRMVGMVVEGLFKEVTKEARALKLEPVSPSSRGKTLKLKQEGGMKLLKNATSAIVEYGKSKRANTKRRENAESEYLQTIHRTYKAAYDRLLANPKTTYEYAQHISQLRNGLVVLEERIASVSYYRRATLLALELGGRRAPRSRLLAVPAAALSAKALMVLIPKGLGMAAKHYGVPTDAASLLAALVPDAISSKYDSIMDMLQSINGTITGMTSGVRGAAETVSSAAGTAVSAVSGGLGSVLRRVGAGVVVNVASSAKDQATAALGKAAQSAVNGFTSAAETIGEGLSAAASMGGSAASNIYSFICLLLFLYIMYKTWKVLDSILVKHNEKVDKEIKERGILPPVNRAAFEEAA
jgi:hypothetical protein